MIIAATIVAKTTPRALYNCPFFSKRKKATKLSMAPRAIRLPIVSFALENCMLVSKSYSKKKKI